MLALSTVAPPQARAWDLAWANLASLSGLNNANRYDPMVPATRLAVFDGMQPSGTIAPAFLETDPGRLELLGVRWVELPSETLVVPGDKDGLGEPLDVVLEPPRPHLFPLPITRATEVRLVSYLSGAVEVEQGTIVAECVARLASGREIWHPIRAGIETAEWAWDRPDVRGRSATAWPGCTRASPRARVSPAISISECCRCRGASRFARSAFAPGPARRRCGYLSSASSTPRARVAWAFRRRPHS